MIVVTSNWALGDGTLVPAAAAWHGTLPAAIHRAATRAGIRRDGSYRPIERLDLVMAGDTFDWLLSAEWQSDVKPWHDTLAARQAAARVARRSIAAARRLLGPVVHWARMGLTVPGAAGARPGGDQVRIPVRVTLLAGDRDASIEQFVGRRRDRQPVTVGSRWDDGRVSIRHGHDLDPACRGAGDRRGSGGRAATLAESIAVDLLGRFATAARPMASGTGRLIRSLAAVGTVGIPAALAAYAGSPASDSSSITDTWRRCVDAWWHEARRIVPACEAEFDAVDAIAGWFAGGSTEWIRVPEGLGRLRPLPPRGSPGLVLGHVHSAAGDSAVVCLGPGPESIGSHGPTVIACPDVGGWPRWRSILPNAEVPAVVSIRAEEPAAAHGGRIVDAA